MNIIQVSGLADESLCSVLGLLAGAVAVDGNIYVVGGDDGSCNLSSVEMFDPAANAWYMLSGSLQIGRSYAAITAIERPVEEQAQVRQQTGSEHEVIRWK